MGILQQLIGESGAELFAGLVERAGFTEDQAERFVPEATKSVVDVVKSSGDLDLSQPRQAAESIVSRIDVERLATETGVETQQASNGLLAMTPKLLQLFQQRAGGVEGVMSLLGGLKGEGGENGMLGGIGKLFGK